MPGFFPGRPGGEHDEPLLDMLIGRRPLPPGAPPEMHDLNRLLTSLAGSAEPGELAGERAALAAFRRSASTRGARSAGPGPSRHRRPRVRSRGRLAAALLATAAGLGAAAAYVGVLPASIQQVAHQSFGAPEPGHPHGGSERAADSASSRDPVPTSVPASRPRPGPSHAGRTAAATLRASARSRPERAPARRGHATAAPSPAVGTRPSPTATAGSHGPRIPSPDTSCTDNAGLAATKAPEELREAYRDLLAACHLP